MDTWTLQAGFPLVSVTLQDGRVSATQARFVVCEENVTDPNEPLNTTIGYRWYVPLTYITSEKPDELAMHWMNLTDGKDLLCLIFLLIYSIFTEILVIMTRVLFYHILLMPSMK